MKKLIVIIFIFSTVLGLIGCSDISTKIPLQDKIVVGVSIVPQATFVKAVAGDLVDIVTMVPPGHSPANYQPSPKQMQLLSNASVYFSIGVPSETYILPKIKKVYKNTKIVDFQQSAEKQYPRIYYSNHSDHEHHHQHGQSDPHIWLSPKRVKVIIKEIENVLIELDPDNQLIYQKNSKAYLKRLEEIDTNIKNMTKDLEYKTFMVYHPVFSYFAEDYGLEMISIEQEGKKASIKNLQQIINLAKQKNIQAILYQAEINSKQSQVIADEIGATTIMVQPLAPDYIDNMNRMVELFRKLLRP